MVEKVVLSQYRDQMEEEIKDVIIWANGQSALTKTTKTVSEGEQSSLRNIQTTFYS